jgi:hypothetical protein
MAEIRLAKALKVKNRLTGRLAKVQADIQGYNSVPAGLADQVNVPALMQTRVRQAVVHQASGVCPAAGAPAFLRVATPHLPVSLLCGLGDARHVAAWSMSLEKSVQVGKKRYPLRRLPPG